MILKTEQRAPLNTKTAHNVLVVLPPDILDICSDHGVKMLTEIKEGSTVDS